MKHVAVFLGAISNSERRARVLLVVLFPIAALIGLMAAIWFPYNVDEGIFISVSHNVMERSLYALSAYDGADVPFQPGISTGPTVLFPTALAMSVLGDTKLATRVVPLVYTLLFWSLTCVIAWRIYGTWASVHRPGLPVY